MMEIDEVTVIEESGGVAYAERRGISSWAILGALLFVFAFIIGWRSGGRKRPKPSDIVNLRSDTEA